MQSEGGAAGTVHGALQTGSLATTFTASQGLLLMIPNMFKIAGELTPAVFHVAARSLAYQALSIFGDHSDVMSARSCGWAMLCGSSTQEAADFAAISHAATLESRIPFMNFFDGFRTSHEIGKIADISDDTLNAMVKTEWLDSFRERALTPDAPVLRGTAQNPDVYFQGRETVNTFYAATPAIVQKAMDKFASLTGRSYHLVDYTGAPDAENVIILMGSGAEAVEETVEAMIARENAKVGVLKVRLFRPFPAAELIKALPATVKRSPCWTARRNPAPRANRSTRTLSRPSLTPRPAETLPLPTACPRWSADATACPPRNSPLPWSREFMTTWPRTSQEPLHDRHQRRRAGHQPSLRRRLLHGSGRRDARHVLRSRFRRYRGRQQGRYQDHRPAHGPVCSGLLCIRLQEVRFLHHLPPALRPAPDQVHVPDHQGEFLALHQPSLLNLFDFLKNAANDATFLMNSPHPADKVWDTLPARMQQQILDKNIKLYTIDAFSVARKTGMGGRINMIMQTCFFKLAGVIPADEAIGYIKKAIAKTYAKKGQEVVDKNIAAVDATLDNLHQVDTTGKTVNGHVIPAVMSANAPEYVQDVLGKMMCGEGDSIPVSQMPVDGTFPNGTSQYENATSPWTCQNGTPPSASSAASARPSARTPPSAASSSPRTPCPALLKALNAWMPSIRTGRAKNLSSRSPRTTARAARSAPMSARPRARRTRPTRP